MENNRTPIYHIGGLFEKQELVKGLINLISECPEMFTGKIGSVYGAKKGMIWSGGRQLIIQRTVYPDNEVNDFLKEHNIRPCLIVSNLGELRKDEIAIDIINNFGVNNLDYCVANGYIENILQQLGANYSQFISSTTRCLSIEEIISACSKYGRVVLSEELNNDFCIFDNTPSNLEVLVNVPCPKHCPKRYEHYLAISNSISNGTNDHPRCLTGYNCSGPLSQIKNNELFINTDGVIKYMQNGVRHFKIAGRNSPGWDWINSIVYYMILPQFQDYIRDELLQIAYKDEFKN